MLRAAVWGEACLHLAAGGSQHHARSVRVEHIFRAGLVGGSDYDGARHGAAAPAAERKSVLVGSAAGAQQLAWAGERAGQAAPCQSSHVGPLRGVGAADPPRLLLHAVKKVAALAGALRAWRKGRRQASLGWVGGVRASSPCGGGPSGACACTPCALGRAAESREHRWQGPHRCRRLRCTSAPGAVATRRAGRCWTRLQGTCRPPRTTWCSRRLGHRPSLAPTAASARQGPRRRRSRRRRRRWAWRHEPGRRRAQPPAPARVLAPAPSPGSRSGEQSCRGCRTCGIHLEERCCNAA